MSVNCPLQIVAVCSECPCAGRREATKPAWTAIERGDRQTPGVHRSTTGKYISSVFRQLMTMRLRYSFYGVC